MQGPDSGVDDGSLEEFAAALRASLDLAPARSAVPAGPPAVAGPDWASAEQPADHSRQAIWVGSVPAKGSSLLGPPPPGAVSSRPRRSAVGRSRGVLRLGARSLLGLVLAAAVVLIIVKLVTQHSPKSALAGHAVTTAQLGPPVNPALQPAGASRAIRRIAAAGDTIVTTGSQARGGVASQQFFVSDDGGAKWYQARVQTPAGHQPGPGHLATLIAGGPHQWLAVGPHAIWTSANGLSWTLAATHGISPDNINVVTATADGFLAAGQTGGNQAVIWISDDGTMWQQLTATKLGLTVAGNVATNIQYATSRGNDTLISDGSDVWLSTDGGTSWTEVPVPAGHGASDSISGLSFDDSGLITVRPGTGASGAQDGVAYFSPNGQAWHFAGLIDPTGGWQPNLVKGSDYGFVVVGTASGRKVAYVSTGTGATWSPTKPLGSTSISSATVGSGGTVIAVGSVGQHVVFIKASPEP